MPVSDRLTSGCLTCGKYLVGGIAAVNAIKIPMSYVPGVEPTSVGNKYQQYFGRGYGFSTSRDHIHHFSFENLNSIKNGTTPMSEFVSDNKLYDVDKANAFAQLPENKAWAKAHLSTADCQNLGFKKGALI